VDDSKLVERGSRPERVVLDERVVGRRRSVSRTFTDSNVVTTTADLVTLDATHPMSAEALAERAAWHFEAETQRDAIVTIASDRREEITLPSGRVAVLPEPVRVVTQIAPERFVCTCYETWPDARDNLYCIDAAGELRWRVGPNPDRTPAGIFRYDLVLVDDDGELWVGNERSMQYRVDVATGIILEKGFAPLVQRWR